MKRIAVVVLALVLVAGLPSAGLAHGVHAEAGTGVVHAIVHALPLVLVLLVAALGAGSGVKAVAARGRR